MIVKPIANLVSILSSMLTGFESHDDHPSLKRVWIFMDETGLIAHSPDQPYFGLGLLKLEETATLYQELNRIAERARRQHGRRFEFKFNRIMNTNRTLYIDFIDAFSQFKTAYFKVFVLDKYMRDARNKHKRLSRRNTSDLRFERKKEKLLTLHLRHSSKPLFHQHQRSSPYRRKPELSILKL